MLLTSDDTVGMITLLGTITLFGDHKDEEVRFCC
jgi:hypothetical protein